jgi:hypothetical protein
MVGGCFRPTDTSGPKRLSWRLCTPSPRGRPLRGMAERRSHPLLRPLKLNKYNGVCQIMIGTDVDLVLNTPAFPTPRTVPDPSGQSAGPV